MRSVQSQRDLGSEFQKVGAATEKALSPKVQCLVMRVVKRRLASDERRLRVEQVSEVTRGEGRDGQCCGGEIDLCGVQM